jgi:hypothetical protein
MGKAAHVRDSLAVTFFADFWISQFFRAASRNVSVLGTGGLFTKRQARVDRGCHPF